MEAVLFLDLYELEALQLLRLDPRERAMQANYSAKMGVLYDMRKSLAEIEKRSAQSCIGRASMKAK